MNLTTDVAEPRPASRPLTFVRRIGPNQRILVAAIVVAVGAGVALTLGARSPDSDPIVAYAAGVPIRLSQARARAEGLATVHGDVSKTLGSDWRRRVIQSIADDVAIEQEAERMGIAVTPKEVQESVARVQAGFPSAEEFARWLLKNRMDRTELGRRARTQLLTARVYDRLGKDLKVTDDEIAASYRANLSEYTVDGKARPLLDVRSSIEDTLLKKKKDLAFGTWLESRRREISLRIVRPDWEVAA